MPITANGVDVLHHYAEGVMSRADHHASQVKGVALALLGGIIWRGEPGSIALSW
jgi:integron cassette protein